MQRGEPEADHPADRPLTYNDAEPVYQVDHRAARVRYDKLGFQAVGELRPAQPWLL
jgi:hypothetical protein